MENNNDKIDDKGKNGFKAVPMHEGKNCELIFACHSENQTPLKDAVVSDENIRYKFIEVAFKGNRREFYRNDNQERFKCGDRVVVEAENGNDCGLIVNCGLLQPKNNMSFLNDKTPKYKFIRKANQEDLKKLNKNNSEELGIILKSREFARKYNNEMKITDAEWQFDRQRLTIYFTAPQRVDFRELVKDLARAFHTRIELRQISSREEVKRITSSIGCCGLELCCHSFLNEFSHVTLDHARVQQLSNNVTKLSGNCGRLKCCLLYEYDHYRVELEKYPPLGSLVKMKDGNYKIIKIDIFNDVLTLHSQSPSKYQNMNSAQIKDLVNQNQVVFAERSEADKFSFAMEDISEIPED